MRSRSLGTWCWVYWPMICCLPIGVSAKDFFQEDSIRPNIVLVVSDDQGYGDAGCYWQTDVETPVMDAMAENGIRFTHFRVNPLCAPTRSSLFTGQYNIENGMWRGPSKSNEGTQVVRGIKSDVKFLSQYVKEAGYVTGIFGKWHLGYESPNLPNLRGFDDFVGFLGGAHRYVSPKNGRLLDNTEPIEDGRHTTDIFTENAIKFIRKNQEVPFFCYVPYNAVHGPLWREEGDPTSGKQEWLEKYEKLGVELPRRDYYAILDHMDDCVGKILGVLRELGLEEKTLFIYLSDNGAMIDKYPGNNGPLRGAKGSTYEGGIRVPAVMQWPGVIPAGSVSSANVVHFDLFSTILDVAGIPIPENNGRHPVHGISMLEHLKSGGRKAFSERYLFWDLYGKMAAVHGNWKIVGEIPNHRGRFAEALPLIRKHRFELYDLDQDVGETRDLAEHYPEILDELKTEYIDWFERASQ